VGGGSWKQGHLLRRNVNGAEKDMPKESRKEKKGKEESLYSAINILRIASKRSDVDHTVLPANYTMPDFPS